MERKKLFENAEELIVPETVLVTGKSLPAYCNGVVLRNGPAKFDLSESFTMSNFYDGYAMLTRFEITNGNIVIMTKKYLDSEAHRKATASGRPCVIEFCTRSFADPEKSILFRHLPDILPVFSDNGNTGIYKIGKDVFTCAETCMFQHVDPTSLKCVGKYDTNQLFSLGLASAHPLTDPDTGVVYNFGPSMMTGLKFHILQIKPSEESLEKTFSQTKTLGSIPTSFYTKFSYNHSFGMTKNYIIMVEQPFQTSVPKVLGAVIRTGQRILDFSTWDKKFRNRFVVISKTTGKVVNGVELRSENPFFFFHFINCYEDEGERIVVDIIGFPDNVVLTESTMIPNLRAGIENEECLPQAQRFVVPILKNLNKIPEGEDLNKDMKTTAKAIRHGKVIRLHPEFLSEPGIEFPTWNLQYTGKPYKYFYGTGFVNTIGAYPNAICKFNTVTKQVLKFKENDESYISEGTFIPNPEGVDEDDGCLITTVTTTKQGAKDFLLFLDGKTMTEIGRAPFVSPIPMSCHGVFLSP